MKFSRITKLFSLLFLSSFMALLINTDANISYAQSTHTITINNNCSDSIWIGANPKVKSVTVGGQSQSTLGGWEMPKGSSATVIVPLNYKSGRFWARTGCSFNAQSVCDPMTVKVNGTDYVIDNCCDTGGCTNSSGHFALDCLHTGLPPSTLAELTFTSGIKDSYDVSMVDGGNISVDIIPAPSTYTCSKKNQDCVNTLNLPGKNTDQCEQDTDCYPLFDDGFKWRCDPNLKLCVNPYYCGSPGCTDKNGCAPKGITQSLLASSTWGGSTGFAIEQSLCPTDMIITDTQNQGSKYVGCIAPQKFCRKSCSSDGKCGPPYTFNCGSSGFCEDSTGTILGAILGANCDTAVGNSTNEHLWGCTGTNKNSCFTQHLTDPNCCGCPNWAPGFPNAFPQGACRAGNNTNWQSASQAIFSIFNDASPSAYAFPYDDAIKLFDCKAKSGSVTKYTINFCCINQDGDGICDNKDTDTDNDLIRNNDETFTMASENQTRNGLGDLNDIDGDGLTNEFDLDSDNDGVPDIVEAGGEALDQDRNGEVDDTTDVDQDGLADVGDPSEGGTLFGSPDTDGDGLPDFIDTDSDNDGFTDFEEGVGTGDNNGDGLPDETTDENRDGLIDAFDPDLGGAPLVIVDSDGDGLPDRLDASDGSNGCTLAPKATTPVSSLIYLLIPAVVLWRRLRIKRNA